MFQSNAKGNLHLPEYASLQQIFNTLSDKVRTSGNPAMGTFLISDEVCGLMVIGKLPEIAALSRIIKTIGSSPLVKMEGRS